MSPNNFGKRFSLTATSKGHRKPHVKYLYSYVVGVHWRETTVSIFRTEGEAKRKALVLIKMHFGE